MGDLLAFPGTEPVDQPTPDEPSGVWAAVRKLLEELLSTEGPVSITLFHQGEGVTGLPAEAFQHPQIGVINVSWRYEHPVVVSDVGIEARLSFPGIGERDVTVLYEPMIMFRKGEDTYLLSHQKHLVETGPAPEPPPPGPRTMRHLHLAYFPEYDGVDNCGFIMQVDDFAEEGPDQGEALRAGTRHLPEEPIPTDELPEGAVSLAVLCAAGDGFSYKELRAAADAWREANPDHPGSEG